MIYGNPDINYNQMAKKAIEKNIGFFLRKMGRPDELSAVLWGGKRIKTSRYKGVCYDPGNSAIKPWRAAYRKKHLGSFPTEELAHVAYELAVSKHKKKKRLKIAA